MEPNNLYPIIAIVSSILGTLATVAGVFWKLGNIQGTLETAISALNETIIGVKGWITDISEGKGPVCATHRQKLEEHERRLNEHDLRFTADERRSTDNTELRILNGHRRDVRLDNQENKISGLQQEKADQ